LAFDDEHIVTGSSDHTVQVWDINSGAPLRSLTGHQYAVWNIKVCATVHHHPHRETGSDIATPNFN
jgi:WD40 repeat protein